MSVTGTWSEALAGEHAAVYAYGVVAARLKAGSADQRRAATLAVAHQQARDAIAVRLQDEGIDPPPPATGYGLPGPVETLADARALGQRLEDRLCVLYAAVVATSTGADRAYALRQTLTTGTALVEWGGAPVALPGVGLP